MTIKSEVKHTPGPWHFSSARTSCDFHVHQKSGVMIAVCGRSTAVENEANARLIAAAPELLAALKGFLDHVGGAADRDLQSLLYQAEDAISKAEGR